MYHIRPAFSRQISHTLSVEIYNIYSIQLTDNPHVIHETNTSHACHSEDRYLIRHLAVKYLTCYSVNRYPRGTRHSTVRYLTRYSINRFLTRRSGKRYRTRQSVDRYLKLASISARRGQVFTTSVNNRDLLQFQTSFRRYRISFSSQISYTPLSIQISHMSFNSRITHGIQQSDISQA